MEGQGENPIDKFRGLKTWTSCTSKVSNLGTNFSSSARRSVGEKDHLSGENINFSPCPLVSLSPPPLLVRGNLLRVYYFLFMYA